MGIGALLSGITGVFTSLFGGIDKISTSDEERLEWRATLTEQYGMIVSSVIELEKLNVSAQKAIFQAEMQHGTWLTRSWRPVVMLAFTTVVVWHSVGTGLGFPVPAVPPDMWTLIKLGLGGYVIGRSGEKIAVNVIGALKKKDQI